MASQQANIQLLAILGAPTTVWLRSTVNLNAPPPLHGKHNIWIPPSGSRISGASRSC